MSAKFLLVTLLAALCGAVITRANPQTVTVPSPLSSSSEGLKMGDPRNPSGDTITLDNNSLRLDGRPWTPVMGEFHYSRYPANEWREELLKMKAGGIDIVTTYVFWIHHEEIEGQWNWSGCRNLRQFVQLCQAVGLKVLVRCGPWGHGEVRNGGFPDWLLQKRWQLRSTDSDYLAQVTILYSQIAKQLNGLLWKDGGPVIGIQLDNEYPGPAEYLLTLKRLAREAGLDVPLYTKTGWPMLSSPLPFGEIVPLYGVYSDGFWDREVKPKPNNYWAVFQLSRFRTDDAIIADLLGKSEAHDPPDTVGYPFLNCEIGGGMENSYHRRIFMNPLDVEATTLVKLGDGSVSLGYYMYQGGVNPAGKLTTLQESQATGGWNDMPVMNYDFQAPLGTYGEIRPQYNLLRRLHLFLHEWGPELADMPAIMPDERPQGSKDIETLRWSVRSDGREGFVFVNNYQRLQILPPKTNVQFTINLPLGPLTFPEPPVTILPDACFFWPFNFDLGNDIRLSWATAQPVCAADDGNVRTVFFAETKGVSAQFAFADDAHLKLYKGLKTFAKGNTIVSNIKPGRAVAFSVFGVKGGEVKIVLLDDADSLALWKGMWQGKQRVFFTRAGLVLDGDKLRLTSVDRSDLNVGICPAPSSVSSDGDKLQGKAVGVFQQFTPRAPRAEKAKAKFESVQSAGPLRKVALGRIQQPVAAEPDDADFKAAAVWKIKLPSDIDLNADPVLRLHYVGDVARVTLNGMLLIDDFYNGKSFDVGLRRYAPEILNGDLRVAILPLQKNAPIFLAKHAMPDFGDAESAVDLKSIEIVSRYQAQLSAP